MGHVPIAAGASWANSSGCSGELLATTVTVATSGRSDGLRAFLGAIASDVFLQESVNGFTLLQILATTSGTSLNEAFGRFFGESLGNLLRLKALLRFPKAQHKS